MDKLPRRAVLLHGVRVISALTLFPLTRQAHAAESTCVDSSSESLRQSLNYVDPTANAAQSCGGCGFFDNKGTCGQCQIMSGPVSVTAHCEAWAAKS